MASNGSDPHTGARGSAPLIGITSYLEQAQTGVWDVRAAFLPEVYLRAVTDAGGIAVVLPPQPSDPGRAAATVAALDGLVLSGGADIDPARYGQDPHPRTAVPRTDRDRFEAALLAAALECELPVLGICRGAQLLNVAQGGTLIQHLPDVVGDDRYQAGGGVFTEIEVEVDAGTRIAALLGPARTARAHLYHHQAIDELGTGLTVTSRTPDGIVQAIELDSVPFGIAVQWHPEEHSPDRRLFAGLVAAAKHYRSARPRIQAAGPPPNHREEP